MTTLAEAVVQSALKKVGTLGDNDVWLALVDLVPDASLRKWADWDSPYCAGGIQRDRLINGLPLYPAPLPYYVPSWESIARQRGEWVTPWNGKRGMYGCADWGGDGVADHIWINIGDMQPNGWIQTVEYNTSKDNSGSQSNGRGCWIRWRHVSYIRGYVDPRDDDMPVGPNRQGLAPGEWKPIQKFLKDMGLYDLEIDDIPDDGTIRALVTYQRLAGFDKSGQDGVFGPLTNAEMRKDMAALDDIKNGMAHVRRQQDQDHQELMKAINDGVIPPDMYELSGNWWTRMGLVGLDHKSGRVADKGSPMDAIFTVASALDPNFVPMEWVAGDKFKDAYAHVRGALASDDAP